MTHYVGTYVYLQYGEIRFRNENDWRPRGPVG